MSLVLDSSVTLAWVYSDETSPAVGHVLEPVSSHGAWVPSLWRLEVANILEMGVRRNRHNAESEMSPWRTLRSYRLTSTRRQNNRLGVPLCVWRSGMA
jgi:hypothetical protein